MPAKYDLKTVKLGYVRTVEDILAEQLQGDIHGTAAAGGHWPLQKAAPTRTQAIRTCLRSFRAQFDVKRVIPRY